MTVMAWGTMTRRNCVATRNPLAGPHVRHGIGSQNHGKHGDDGHQKTFHRLYSLGSSW
ncbi:MAG: hypothetical protein IKX22_05445 [Prevotella sp.]|nr:hypothetical protein [Prevotella sp.]